ncbi:Protein of unknown function [Pseudorhodobacter antarcticus]|jgi:hypothetical protein|uniref:DUF3775 domain-containing protein n=1 Tax=Pseudorhodobacter antarcticus TaxID=1077947 RepID=A0A1H8I7L2_9RHOB|nr:DUF3775 domain-containing protein [Pseudorhodobacter antarcticus]SEN64800.1 Protein of unknown function [Pseudorhodobacter antarcticus]
MIEISPSKVVQIIFQAREGHVAARELSAFIENLNVDEQAHLTAIAWIGRGSFEVEEYAEALHTARTEKTTPTADYLMGMPHLAENLEAGLDAMGVDVDGEEEDLL